MTLNGYDFGLPRLAAAYACSGNIPSSARLKMLRHR
jgi:hypothetical protein